MRLIIAMTLFTLACSCQTKGNGVITAHTREQEKAALKTVTEGATCSLDGIVPVSSDMGAMRMEFGSIHIDQAKPYVVWTRA